MLLYYDQPIKTYPGELYWTRQEQVLYILGEDDFNWNLKRILSSTESQNVIKWLFSQAKDLPDDDDVKSNFTEN